MSPRRSVQGEFLGTLLVVIVVSGALTYGGNLLLAGRAVDEMVAQTDLEVARSMASTLALFYEKTGSWTDVNQEIRRLRSRAPWAEPQDGDPEREEKEARETTPLILTDAEGRLVYNGFNLVERGKPVAYPTTYNTRLGQPVRVASQTVGYLFFKTMVFRVYNPREQQFLQTITTTLGVSLGFQVVIALLLGWFLASRFVRPITHLETAVKRISEGSLYEHVDVRGPSEIASLSAHFNAMVDQLQAQETSRQNLLADIAHELRTPVSILQANLEMMIEGVYPADASRLTSLHEETQLLTKLIEDLRTISDWELGISSDPWEPVDLAGVIEESCQKHQPLFGDRGIVLVLQKPEGAVTVRADPYRVAQVLGNLLSNALRYASESAQVRVEVSVVQVREPETPRARVAVIDQGPGVLEAERERLFQRFYRTDRSRNRQRGGRGLGLAIVERFVTSWGGTVGAENRTPHGLEVWFEVPLLPAPF